MNLLCDCLQSNFRRNFQRSIFPGSAEALVIGEVGNKVPFDRLRLSNISAKNYHNRLSFVLEAQCIVTWAYYYYNGLAPVKCPNKNA